MCAPGSTLIVVASGQASLRRVVWAGEVRACTPSEMYERERERERIARLKTFAAQLERLPPSRARDGLLREVRHRAVMLEIGVPSSSAWRDRPEHDAALFQQRFSQPDPAYRLRPIIVAND